MRCWCILFVVLNFYKGQTARLFQPLSTTDNEGTKNTDILRQLLNQETLIRLSLSRDVQFLLKQQRSERKTDQAVKKTLVDLQASVQRLTNVTDDLNLRNDNLTNEFTSLILKNKQELEGNDRSQDKKLGVLERYLEELSNQTTQQLMFIGDVNSNIKNMSTQIAGNKNALLNCKRNNFRFWSKKQKNKKNPQKTHHLVCLFKGEFILSIITRYQIAIRNMIWKFQGSMFFMRS